LNYFWCSPNKKEVSQLNKFNRTVQQYTLPNKKTNMMQYREGPHPPPPPQPSAPVNQKNEKDNENDISGYVYNTADGFEQDPEVIRY
jgi:hypothetical protein